MKSLRDYIYEIPDFPAPGILFRDITGILDSGAGFGLCCADLADAVAGLDFDLVAGIESRGFIFGAPLSERFHKPFVPVRKKGKLPRKTISQTYALEYGEATIEIHEDAVKPGQRVVLVDDLLATGGTMLAAYELVKSMNPKKVYINFICDLADLHGREVFPADVEVTSLFTF